MPPPIPEKAGSYSFACDRRGTGQGEERTAEDLMAGWTQPDVEDDEDLETPGGAPVIVEDFFPGRFRSEASGSEESGAWCDLLCFFRSYL